MNIIDWIFNPCRNRDHDVMYCDGSFEIKFHNLPLASLNNAVWYSRKYTSTSLLENFFVKKGAGLKELFYAISKKRNSYGIQLGILGEFSSTIESYERGVPVHKPIAIRISWRDPYVVTFYERVKGKITADSMLTENICDPASILLIVMSFIELSVMRGVFIGDPNLTNVFIFRDLEEPVWVDLENTIIYKCDFDTALTLNLAKLWSRQTRKHYSKEKFLDILHTYFNGRSSVAERNDLIYRNIVLLVNKDVDGYTKRSDRVLRYRVLMGYLKTTMVFD